MELEHHVAFVTGAGSGIGRAAARLLAAEGAQVGAFDHDAQAVDETVRLIHAAGGNALPLAGDVSIPEDVQRAVDSTASVFGRLDIVLANAGINGVWAPFDELTPEEWDRTMAVNLRGTFLTAKYAVPHLRRAGGGSIIITSSVNGTRVFSNPGASAYSCTKAAQVAFAKTAALELAKDRIRVNVVLSRVDRNQRGGQQGRAPRRTRGGAPRVPRRQGSTHRRRARQSRGRG